MRFSAAIGEVQKALRRSVKQIVVFGGGVLVVLVAISLMTNEPVVTFFLLLSYVGVVMTVFGAVVMLLTFRTARTIAPSALAVSMATTLATSALSLGLAQGRPSWTVVLAMLAVGALTGGFWSSTLLLSVDGAAVRARGTLWYLAIWAATFAVNQVFAGFTGATPVLGALALTFGAGLSLGNCLGLILRILRISRRYAAAPSGEAIRAD
jgi:hypothetical protein